MARVVFATICMLFLLATPAQAQTVSQEDIVNALAGSGLGLFVDRGCFPQGAVDEEISVPIKYDIGKPFEFSDFQMILTLYAPGTDVGTEGMPLGAALTTRVRMWADGPNKRKEIIGHKEVDRRYFRITSLQMRGSTREGPWPLCYALIGFP